MLLIIISIIVDLTELKETIFTALDIFIFLLCSPTVTLPSPACRPPYSAVDSVSGDCPPLSSSSYLTPSPSYRMIAISNSLLLSTTPSLHFTSGSSLKSGDTTKLAFSPRCRGKSPSSRRSITVQAEYSDAGRPSNSSIFVGGFLLGGVIIGALGCVFAPEISKALAETDKKDLMRKLPKFIYDEEKALEKQRKILTEKIVQLNDAIDNISNQLRSGDAENGAAVNLDEAESII